MLYWYLLIKYLVFIMNSFIVSELYCKLMGESEIVLSAFDERSR